MNISTEVNRRPIPITNIVPRPRIQFNNSFIDLTFILYTINIVSVGKKSHKSSTFFYRPDTGNWVGLEIILFNIKEEGYEIGL